MFVKIIDKYLWSIIKFVILKHHEHLKYWTSQTSSSAFWFHQLLSPQARQQYTFQTYESSFSQRASTPSENSRTARQSWRPKWSQASDDQIQLLFCGVHQLWGGGGCCDWEAKRGTRFYHIFLDITEQVLAGVKRHKINDSHIKLDTWTWIDEDEKGGLGILTRVETWSLTCAKCSTILSSPPSCWWVINEEPKLKEDTLVEQIKRWIFVCVCLWEGGVSTS